MKILFAIIILTATFFGAIHYVSAEGATGNLGPTIKVKEVSANYFLNELNRIYTLGLALVGLSALFYIVWGGIEYIYAGENSSQVNEAKSKIKNALWGIAIAALSFAILNTINPDLVSQKLNLSESVKKYQEEVKKYRLFSNPEQ